MHTGLGLHITRRLLGSVSGASALLAGETDGLAFDFTNQSALIRDTSTPANAYNSIGIVNDGELVGPSGKLTYTSPSNKLTLQSDGVMRYQAHNLCPQSEDLTAATGSWTETNVSTVANSGGATPPANYAAITSIANNATAGAHSVFKAVSAVAGAPYALEVVAKYNDNQYLGLSINNLSNANEWAAARFDLINGTVAATNNNGSSAVVVSTSIDDIGGGWYKCRLVGSQTGTTIWALVSVENDSTTFTTSLRGRGSYSGGGELIYVSGAHVYRYPANTDYIRTTSAAKYALPLEYDTSGNCLGLLVEEARTNLLTYSTDFANAAWSPDHDGSAGLPTVTSNTTVAPDGTTTADTFAVPAVSGAQWSYVTQTAVCTAVAHTISVWLKGSVGGETVYLAITPDGVNYVSRSCTLTTEWQRFDVTGTLTNTTWYYLIGTDLRDGTQSATSAQTFYVWQAQLEVGSFPTSPVVTFGSSSTRAADNISIATSAFPYSATAGSVYYQGAFVGVSTASTLRPWTLCDGTTSEVIAGGYVSSAPSFIVNDGGVSQVNISVGTIADGVTYKHGSAWEANNFNAAKDGTVGTLDTSGTLPTVTTLYIGSRETAASHANGHIKAISYVPRRKDDIELAVETGYSLPTGYTTYGAWDLFGTESSALAFDFTDQSVVNTKTPLVSQGIVSDGELVGPGAALTYTSPSNKLTLQSDGFLRYQAHNFAYYSEDFSQNGSSSGLTVTSDNVAGPPGFELADKIEISGGGYLYKQSLAELAVGGSYTVKCWMRADSTTTLLLRIYDDVVGDIQTAEQVITSDWTLVTWPSCAVTAGASSYYFGIDTRSGVGGDDAAKTFYAIGTHVHRYPANTDYIRTTTAAKYALPIEYDTSGTCLGLLVEEQRTNLCLRSTSLDTSGTWAQQDSVVVTANQSIGPTGLMDLDEVGVAGAGAGFPRIVQTVSTSGTCTFSAYVKNNNATTLELYVTGTGLGGGADIISDYTFTFSTATLSKRSGATADSTFVEDLTSIVPGLYRIGITLQSTTITDIRFYPSWNSTTTKSCYIGYVQLEVGSFPTSPIITYGAAATRAVDNLSIASTAFPWSATAWTFSVENDWRPAQAGVVGWAFGGTISGGGLYGVRLNTTTDIKVYARDGSPAGLSNTDTLNNAASNVPVKTAIAYATNDQAASSGGLSAVTSAAGGALSGTTTLYVGSYDAAATPLNGVIKTLTYVPRRKSNAELQTETA